ncbi:hypothetical protein, partial [Streptomyces sp. NPDC058157]|uniref:hypothetical protein n=1 Tax=Streptomyces sp. NPDC058157 TaxID=3346360 RepID=UPI0036E8718D
AGQSWSEYDRLTTTSSLCLVACQCPKARQVFSKEPHPPKWAGYQLLALIFGTLLSSQGTDASFVLALSGFPPGFRSFFVSDSIRSFRA